MNSTNRRLFVVFLLGITSGLPYSLLSGTLQAWYTAAGISVIHVGLLSLLNLPYTFRFLFSPILDNTTPSSLGKRRGWIVYTQFILLCGFNVISWLNPQDYPILLSVLALFLAFVSSLQDIVVDAQRIEYLEIDDHAWGASLAMLGYRLALIVGGGVGLVLAYHIGWGWTYRLLGSLMLIGLVTTWFSAEPIAPQRRLTFSIQQWILPLKEWFKRPYGLICIFFIFFYKTGEAFTSSSSGIVMPFLLQGLGFSLDIVGYVNKGIGVTALVIGGLVAGWLLRYKNLFSALFYFGLFQIFANIFFLILVSTGKSLPVLTMAVLLDNLASGMCATGLVALLMRLVCREYTATQFAFLISISMLPRTLSGPIGGAIYMYLGWMGVYIFALCVSTLFLPFLFILKKMLENRETPTTSLVSSST